MIDFLLVGFLIILTIYISYGFGEYVLVRFNLRKYVFLNNIVVGFYSFLALYQILIYPIQHFHFDTRWLSIVLVFLLVIVVFLSKDYLNLYKIKEKLNWKYICLFLFILTIIVCIYYLCNNYYFLVGFRELGFSGLIDDATYYIRLVAVNANPGNPTNLIEVVNGNRNSILSAQYAYSGVFHLFSAICMLFNLREITFITWYSFLIIRILNLLIAFSMYKEFSKRNKLLGGLAFLYISSLVLIFHNTTNGFTPVFLRSITGIDNVLMLCLIYHFKDKDNGLIKMYTVLTFSMIACQSTQFFLSAFLLVGLAVVDVVLEKRINFKKLLITGLPVFVFGVYFVCALNRYDGLVLIGAIGVYFLVISQSNKLTKHINYRVFYVFLVLAIICIYVYGVIVNNGVYTLSESFDYFKTYFTLNQEIGSYNNKNSMDIFSWFMTYVYVLFMIVGLFFRKKLPMELQVSCLLISTIIIVFYNPLSMPFVSTYFTNVVYHRIHGGVFFSVIILMLIDYLSHFVRIIPILALASAFTIVPYTIDNVKLFIDNHNTYSDVVDSKYKVSNEIIYISNFLKDYTSGTDMKVLYPITISNIKLFEDDIQLSTLMPNYGEMAIEGWTSMYDELSDNMKLQCYLYLPLEYFTDYFYAVTPESVPDIEGILMNSDADIVIFKKWEEFDQGGMFYYKLSQFTELIYDNGNYQIFRIIRN